jgi:predicted nucleic-acid-binding protein
MKIAADTNVLIRYLIWDDAAQAEAAAVAIESADSVFVSIIVLCEIAWVLQRSYRYTATEIASTLRRLVTARNIEVDRPAAESGLATLECGGDFADGAIQSDAARAGCHRLVTFDREFARLFDPAEVVLLGA